MTGRELDPCLYHIVPSDMRGGHLVSLERLRELWPDLAVEAARKYAGRESLMEAVIPILGCRWNGAIHLTPLHRAKTCRALLSAGVSPRPLEFFAIPARLLDGARAVSFANSRDTEGRYDFDPGDFAPFNPGLFGELDAVPEEQAKAFRAAVARGERPLLWGRTPHVFYRGDIDVTGLRRFSWEVPV